TAPRRADDDGTRREIGGTRERDICRGAAAVDVVDGDRVRRACSTAPDPGEPPAVCDVTQRLERGALAGDVRQLPEEVRVHDIYLRMVIAEEDVGLRLVGPERNRPVRIVLKTCG